MDVLQLFLPHAVVHSISVEGYELKVEIKYTLCSGKKPFCFCITIRKINQFA